MKVQRPNLKAIYDKDVALLRTIFKALDRFKVSVGVDQAWGAIFDDAADLLYREIDYRCEAMLKMGMYMAMTRPPMTTPRPTMMMGSSMDVRFSTAWSTSSS